MKLSIITPVYNASVHHLQALSASIPDAVGTLPFEWLLVDDHSERDDTRNCLEQLARHPRTRLMRNERGKGAAGARNHGAANASGRLLVFADADDLFVPGALQFLVTAIDDNPRIRWLAGDFMDFDDRATDPVATPALPSTADVTIEHWPDAAQRLIFETLFTQGSYVIDKALFDRARGFDERFRIGEDWYLWMHLAVRRELYYSHRVVLLQRRGHTSTMSGPLGLTDAIVRPYIVARSDPRFTAYRKPLRWRIYHLYRLLSKRNQAEDGRGAAVRFAAMAALWGVNEPRQWMNVLRALAGRQVR